MSARRQTLARPVTVRGIGIHTGEPSSVVMSPAAFGEGVRFMQGGTCVPATLANARAEPGCTVLVSGDAAIYTPEHLLAALCALGITDVILEIVGPEVPALDGSARPWVFAIDRAGRSEGPPLLLYRAEREFTVCAAGGQATIGAGDQISVEVDFPGGPSGSLCVPQTESAFRRDIMWARTFVRDEDIPLLRAQGRGRGASSANTVVWPQGPLRAPDEPVRHKLLDAWGDLALLGPCAVSMTVVRGSHILHHALLDLLKADRRAAQRL